MLNENLNQISWRQIVENDQIEAVENAQI